MTHAAATSSALPKSLTDCISSAATKWTFPRSDGGPVTTRIPYHLQAG